MKKITKLFIVFFFILAVSFTASCTTNNVFLRSKLEKNSDEVEVVVPQTDEPESEEPEITEPEITEPEITEPEITEPEITEPEQSEQPTFTLPTLQNHEQVAQLIVLVLETVRDNVAENGFGDVVFAESDRAEYEHMCTVTTQILGPELSATIYFNASQTKSHKHHECETNFEGLIIFANYEFKFDAELEIEHKEIEAEITVFLTDNAFINVEAELEHDELEAEAKLVVNGETLLFAKGEIEEEKHHLAVKGSVVYKGEEVLSVKGIVYYDEALVGQFVVELKGYETHYIQICVDNEFEVTVEISNEKFFEVNEKEEHKHHHGHGHHGHGHHGNGHHGDDQHGNCKK